MVGHGVSSGSKVVWFPDQLPTSNLYKLLNGSLDLVIQPERTSRCMFASVTCRDGRSKTRLSNHVKRIEECAKGCRWMSVPSRQGLHKKDALS